jgi:hypothetical protein
MANGRAGQPHAYARMSYFNRTKLSDVLGPGILGMDCVLELLFRFADDQRPRLREECARAGRSLEESSRPTIQLRSNTRLVSRRSAVFLLDDTVASARDICVLRGLKLSLYTVDAAR